MDPPVVAASYASSCEESVTAAAGDPGMIRGDNFRCVAPSVMVTWAPQEEATIFATKETITDQMARVSDELTHNIQTVLRPREDIHGVLLLLAWDS